MFETRHRSLPPRRHFLLRMGKSGILALLLLIPSWGIGILGYHFLVNLAWIDAVLNAAMILTGMGPVNPVQSVAGKLFASFYALFSGIVFITMAAVLLGPVAHRFLHRFHLEVAEPPKERKQKGE